MAHKRDDGKERVYPEYSFDYCFPGDEFGYRWTVLVGRERSSGNTMATTIPTKGGGHTFGYDKCMDFINNRGFNCYLRRFLPYGKVIRNILMCVLLCSKAFTR